MCLVLICHFWGACGGQKSENNSVSTGRQKLIFYPPLPSRASRLVTLGPPSTKPAIEGD